MSYLYFCTNHPDRRVSEADDYCELCDECLAAKQERDAERAYERQQEEGFRGGEAAAYLAEQQDKARRLK